LLPAATVTEVGTVAEAVLLDNATDTPPEGAAALKVTVPVADVKLATLVGLTETEESDTGTGITVSEAVGLAPP
jgi:hypothetical protein